MHEYDALKCINVDKAAVSTQKFQSLFTQNTVSRTIKIYACAPASGLYGPASNPQRKTINNFFVLH